MTTRLSGHLCFGSYLLCFCPFDIGASETAWLFLQELLDREHLVRLQAALLLHNARLHNAIAMIQCT
jgi:hypothetical protein